MSFKAGFRFAAFLTIAFFGIRAHAQLQWGVNGAGGSGTWDATSVNWFDGTQNTAWAQSGTAIFGGSGGTVTASTFEVTAGEITFNAPAYTLSNGWIFAGSNGLQITTNADAAISTTLSSEGFSGDLLVKNGAGTLSMGGTNFLRTVQINAGEYRLIGGGTLFFSKVAVAAGARVTLGQTFTDTQMGGLSGSGIVQPDASARTVNLTLFSAGSFSGTLQDNGSGKLGIRLFASSGAAVWSGANTYSGATDISVGSLSLAGASGSALNTAALSIGSSGTLLLDNTGAANANRLSNAAPVTLTRSTLRLDGNGAVAVNETVGAVTFSGASTIAVNRTGGVAAALTIAGLTRSAHATMNVSGDGQLLGTGVANLGSGIAPVYLRSGSDWATVDANGALAAFTNYAANPATAGVGDHVKISSLVAVSGTQSWASLNLRNEANSSATLLQGGTVQLGSGGLLSTGNAETQIQQTNLTTSAAEFVITNENDLALSGSIQQTAPGLALTKSGRGTLRLTAPNTYSGITTVNEGTLAISNSNQLGTSPALEFGGGVLQAAADITLSQNITRSTSSVAILDTGAYTVVFTGSNSSLQKTGSGTLRMTNASIGSVSIAAGVLDLGSANGGSVTLENGTLIAAGTLAGLRVISGPNIASTLDIGGAAAATLRSNLNLTSSSGRLTINFGLGSSGVDLWTLEPSASLSSGLPNGFFQFKFQPLGEIALNTKYTLMSSISPSAFTGVSNSLFSLAPELIAAGWSATFSTAPNVVQVSFTNVPEPGTALLLMAAAGAWKLGRRRG